MNSTTLDKDIPLERVISKYPFLDMEVGDSFFVKSEAVRRTRNAAYQYAMRHRVNFSVLQWRNDYRCWRVK